MTKEQYLWISFFLCALAAGMQARVPQSPIVGMMWLDPTRSDILNNIRHEAKQEDGTI